MTKKPKATSQKAFAKGAQKAIFTPEIADTCIPGQQYVYPGKGPVRCAGVEEIQVTGIGALQTIVFEEGNNILRVPKGKLSSVGVRQLTDEKTFDAILVKISKADGKGFFEGGKTGGSALLTYNRLLAGDLNELAELISKTLGSNMSTKNGAPTGMNYGEQAASRIAAEYAIVKKVDFDTAYALVLEKATKNGGAKAKPPESAPVVTEVSANLT